MNTLIEQFDIWLADLNPGFGTESGKIRPVVIVQADIINHLKPRSSIVCPITSQVQRKSKILRVHLKSISTGLRGDSDVMLDQIRAVDNKRLIRKIGKVPTQLHAFIRNNLISILDLQP